MLPLIAAMCHSKFETSHQIGLTKHTKSLLWYAQFNCQQNNNTGGNYHSTQPVLSAIGSCCVLFHIGNSTSCWVYGAHIVDAVICKIYLMYLHLALIGSMHATRASKTRRQCPSYFDHFSITHDTLKTFIFKAVGIIFVMSV